MPHIDMREYQQEGLMMVQAICKNFEGYTRKEVETAILACKIQVMMGYPTNNSLKLVVGTLKNCLINFNNCTNAIFINGPRRGNIGGKTVRQRLERVSVA